MGSLVPILSSPLFMQGVGLVKNEISRQSSRVDRGAALENLKAKQSLQLQQSQANAALSREKIALDASNAEKERKTALRRAVSRQRASFGAQGIGSGAGSSQAVLLGMFEESESEKSKRAGLDNFRLNAIDSDLSQRKSLNVLQRTQLKERNKLQTVSAFGDTAFGALGLAHIAAKSDT